MRGLVVCGSRWGGVVAGAVISVLGEDVGVLDSIGGSEAIGGWRDWSSARTRSWDSLEETWSKAPQRVLKVIDVLEGVVSLVIDW